MHTSAECWKFLEQQYQPQGNAHSFARWIDWINLQYDGKDLPGLCSACRAALVALAETDIKIDEKATVFQFIHIISPFFENFTREQKSAEYKKPQYTMFLELKESS